MIDLLTACPDLGPILSDAQEVSGYLWQRGWAERNAGNMSIDVSDHLAQVVDDFDSGEWQDLPSVFPSLGGRCYLVTGTGRRFRDFARDSENNSVLLRIDDDGIRHQVLWGGLDVPDIRPTSEFPSHLRLQQHLRSSGGRKTAVLHTHPTELIALTHMLDCVDQDGLNQALWSVHPELRVFLPRGVGLVSYTLPGSEALGIATVEQIQQGCEVAVWQYHGCLAVGADVLQAFDLIDTVNKAARISLMCRAAGQRPNGLGSEEQEELAELAKMFRD
jgi:rhamnulose-1-phosphate aldolase